MNKQVKHGQRKDFHRHDSGKHYLFTVIAILFIAMAGVFMFKGGLTGQFIAGNMLEYNQSLDISIDTDYVYNWTLQEHPEIFNLKSVELSGSYLGNGSVKVYLETDTGRYLVLDSDTLEPEHLESVTAYAVASDGSDSGGDSSGDSGGGSSSSGSGDSGGGSDSSGDSGSNSGGDSSSTGNSGSGDSGDSDGDSGDGGASSDSGDSSSESSSGSDSSDSSEGSDSSDSGSAPSESAPSEAPSESPSENTEPSDEPSQQPSETPSDEHPTEEPAEETPADEQVEEPSEEPTEEITENPIEEPVEEEPVQEQEPIDEEAVEEEQPEEEIIEEIKESEETITEDIEEELEEIEENITEDLEEVEENITEIEENIAEIEDNVTEIQENLTEIIENITEITENITLIENITEFNITLPENITDVNITLNESLWARFDFTQICLESCLLPDGLNSTNYNLVFELEGELELDIDTITYALQNLTIPDELIEVQLNIRDHLGELVDADIEVTGPDFSDTIRNGQAFEIMPDYYDVTVRPQILSFNAEQHAVRNLTFKGVDLTESITEFLEFEYLEQPISSDFTQQYSINPLIGYSSASATLLANNSELYRCDSWNFTEQICLTGWTRLDTNIAAGQEYVVDIQHLSQSFAEGFNVTNITWFKVKDDERYEAIIDSAETDDQGTLTVVFHHNAPNELPISIIGRVKDYSLSTDTASGSQPITLTIPAWNNRKFRIKVGAESEVFEFGQAEEFRFNGVIKNSRASTVPATIRFIDTELGSTIASLTSDTEQTIDEGTYDITVTPDQGPVKEILFESFELYENISDFINIDDVGEENTSYVKIYAIDPTEFNFTNATVTVTATGTELYKCKDWNFTTQTCFGTWTLFKTGLVPGQDYTFILTPDDPGFAETDSLQGFGTFNTTADFNQWTHTGADADGDFVHDTTIYRLGGGSLRAENIVGRNKYWATDYMNRSTTSIEAGSEVTLNWSWRKSYVSVLPISNILYIDLVTPSQSVNTVWTNSDSTWNTWTDESLNISSYITETGAYEVRLRIDLKNPNDGASQTLAWFDEVFVYVLEEIIDETVPASVTNLANQSVDPYSIYWNWTNPTDEDFNSTIIYLDGVNVVNLSAPVNYYNATGLEDETNYTITVHTMDHTGNVNDTDVNSTVTTQVCGIQVNNISDSPDPVTQGEIINFTANVTSISQVDTVLVEVDANNYTMLNSSEDIWTYSYNTTSLNPDTYAYFVTANCSEGYWADTENSTFSVQPAEAAINITDIMILPDDDDQTAGSQVNPIEDGNVSLTLIANITNQSATGTCELRIFNESDTYESPTLSVVSGTIQKTGDQTQCNATWDMDYWRNSGYWNISVDINLSDLTPDQENTSCYYNVLVAHEVNVTNVSFSGIPGQTVNSTDAYPLLIRNTGNAVVNISINSSDFIGQENSSYTIGVGNATYNESESGTYVELAEEYKLIYDLPVLTTKELYFKGYIPSGTITQEYQADINIRSE
ncbi:hypothetical protein KY337_05785 [Candidatus Woesearchaeota archaeon]|nr:hypothetical protein [Candidatus Woesearchaeota archaeon]